MDRRVTTALYMALGWLSANDRSEAMTKSVNEDAIVALRGAGAAEDDRSDRQPI
jgi:hypothetical protein